MPSLALLRLGAILALVVGLVVGTLLVLKHERALGAAECRAEYATAAASATAAALAERKRIDGLQSESNNEAQRLASRARDDAAGAAAASERLRVVYRSSGGACTGNPGTASVGSAASAPVDLRADVFGELDDRAGILAAALDQSYIAGKSCERAYDALTKP